MLKAILTKHQRPSEVGLLDTLDANPELADDAIRKVAHGLFTLRRSSTFVKFAVTRYMRAVRIAQGLIKRLSTRNQAMRQRALQEWSKREEQLLAADSTIIRRMPSENVRMRVVMEVFVEQRRKFVGVWRIWRKTQQSLAGQLLEAATERHALQQKRNFSNVALKNLQDRLSYLTHRLQHHESAVPRFPGVQIDLNDVDARVSVMMRKEATERVANAMSTIGVQVEDAGFMDTVVRRYEAVLDAEHVRRRMGRAMGLSSGGVGRSLSASTSRHHHSRQVVRGVGGGGSINEVVVSSKRSHSIADAQTFLTQPALQVLVPSAQPTPPGSGLSQSQRHFSTNSHGGGRKRSVSMNASAAGGEGRSSRMIRFDAATMKEATRAQPQFLTDKQVMEQQHFSTLEASASFLAPMTPEQPAIFNLASPTTAAAAAAGNGSRMRSSVSYWSDAGLGARSGSILVPNEQSQYQSSGADPKLSSSSVGRGGVGLQWNLDESSPERSSQQPPQQFTRAAKRCFKTLGISLDVLQLPVEEATNKKFSETLHAAYIASDIPLVMPHPTKGHSSNSGSNPPPPTLMGAGVENASTPTKPNMASSTMSASSSSSQPHLGLSSSDLSIRDAKQQQQRNWNDVVDSRLSPRKKQVVVVKQLPRCPPRVPFVDTSAFLTNPRSNRASGLRKGTSLDDPSRLRFAMHEPTIADVANTIPQTSPRTEQQQKRVQGSAATLDEELPTTTASPIAQDKQNEATTVKVVVSPARQRSPMRLPPTDTNLAKCREIHHRKYLAKHPPTRPPVELPPTMKLEDYRLRPFTPPFSDPTTTGDEEAADGGVDGGGEQKSTTGHTVVVMTDGLTPTRPTRPTSATTHTPNPSTAVGRATTASKTSPPTSPAATASVVAPMMVTTPDTVHLTRGTMSITYNGHLLVHGVDPKTFAATQQQQQQRFSTSQNNINQSARSSSTAFSSLMPVATLPTMSRVVTSVALLHTTTQSAVSTSSSPHSTRTSSWSTAAVAVAVGASDGSLRVYSLRDTEVCLLMDAPSNRTSALMHLEECGSYLCCSCEDKNVYVYHFGISPPTTLHHAAPATSVVHVGGGGGGGTVKGSSSAAMLSHSGTSYGGGSEMHTPAGGPLTQQNMGTGRSSTASSTNTTVHNDNASLAATKQSGVFHVTQSAPGGAGSGNGVHQQPSAPQRIVVPSSTTSNTAIAPKSPRGREPSMMLGTGTTTTSSYLVSPTYHGNTQPLQPQASSIQHQQQQQPHHAPRWTYHDKLPQPSAITHMIPFAHPSAVKVLDLLAVSTFDHRVLIWNVADASLHAILEDHSQGVHYMFMSVVTGVLVTCSYDSTVRLWEPVDGSGDENGDRVGDEAAARTGALRLSTNSNRSNKRLAMTFGGSPTRKNGGNTSVGAFIADNSSLLLVDSSSRMNVTFGGSSNSIDPADLPASYVSTAFTQHTRAVVHAVDVAGHERAIASISRDGTICLWDQYSLEAMCVITHVPGHLFVGCVAFPRTSLISYVFSDGSMRVYSTLSGKMTHQLAIPQQHPPQCATRVSESGMMAVGTASGHVYIVSSESGDVVSKGDKTHGLAVTCLVALPEEAVGGGGGGKFSIPVPHQHHAVPPHYNSNAPTSPNVAAMSSSAPHASTRRRSTVTSPSSAALVGFLPLLVSGGEDRIVHISRVPPTRYVPPE